MTDLYKINVNKKNYNKKFYHLSNFSNKLVLNY